jgi:hypothetical protein
VMHAGKLTTALSSANWTRDSLGLAMTGSLSAAPAAHRSERIQGATP